MTAKGGADVGATSAFILSMVDTMTITATFLSPYVIKICWKAANALKQKDDAE